MYLHLNSKKINVPTQTFIFNDSISINKVKRSASLDDVNCFMPGIIFDYKNEDEEDKNESKSDDKNSIEFKVDISNIEEIKSETNLNLVQSEIQQNDIIYTVKKNKIKITPQFIINILLNILLIIGVEFKFERWMYFFIIGQIINFSYKKN